MDQEKLVKQEQEILDKVIQRMDSALLKIDKNLKSYDLQIRKANAACLPDAYGALVSAQNNKAEGKARLKVLGLSRNELYKTRIEVKYTDTKGTGREDIKIGLHSFIYGAEVFIMSWVMPISRHYLLDNADREFDNETTDRNGVTYHTHYELLKKRDVNLDFDRVKEVIQKFPVYDEEEGQIVADEFLKELLRRRSEREFQNIVFSIQRQQSEIIQAPFKQNMIVQGCAGSGKSMIMLHRLPIIIYDNPKGLNRSNIYIITPSIAYIQMAHNMMMELEIEDLKMGTLNQYYDHVLALYGIPQRSYGNIREGVAVEKSRLQYIYSQDFINDIRKEIEEAINAYPIDFDRWHRVLGMEVPRKQRESTYRDIVHHIIVEGQKLLNRQIERQKHFHQLLKNVIGQFNELANILSDHKSTVISNLDKKIQHTQDEYFDTLRTLAEDKIREMLQQFDGYDSNFEKIAEGNIYMLYVLKRHICDFYGTIKEELLLIHDDHKNQSGKIESFLRKMEGSIKALSEYHDEWLRYDEVRYLKDALNYYRGISDTVVRTIYRHQMDRLKDGYNFRENNLAFSCSPYMYLQILFQYRGIHDKRKESLITIDEAQNLMPQELKLIRELNNNGVVINLFGDVKQHIEGTKGIDSWEEFDHVASFAKYEMMENYRNARQITNYCNKKFGINMRAINMDGKGVHIVAGQDELYRTVRQMFMNPQNPGLSCIIVKNVVEAKAFLEMFSEYSGKIQKIALEPQDINPGRWNLMRIDQVKGLEFETVISLSGRMSTNEKYIAYTRALNELFIFDTEILPAERAQFSKDKKADLPGNNRERAASEIRKGNKAPDIGIKEFCELSGFEVVDLRKKKGLFWIIGERGELEEFIKQVSDRYGVSGKYMKDKATGFRMGWCVKMPPEK